jgi:YggT family protein
MEPWDEVHRMRAILDVVLLILSLYTWIIIASAVLSWLLAFNVINYSNSVVR